MLKSFTDKLENCYGNNYIINKNKNEKQKFENHTGKLKN